jgi:hypothetical protein
MPPSIPGVQMQMVQILRGSYSKSSTVLLTKVVIPNHIGPSSQVIQRSFGSGISSSFPRVL